MLSQKRLRAVLCLYFIFFHLFYPTSTSVASIHQPAGDRQTTACSNEIEEDVVFFLQKTSCFGECPVYTLKVYSNGDVFLNGESYIPYLGCHKSLLSSANLQSLKEKFSKSQFFGFKDQYYEGVTDLPTTYIYYRDGRLKKKVMDYYGSPQELKDLELLLEKLVDQLKWKPIN